MITTTQAKALTILSNTSYLKPMRVSEFALLMWPESKMHSTVKNTGNGSVQGKAAWLCGGSYLSKLERLKLVYKTYSDNGNGVSVCYISELGKKALQTDTSHF